MSVWSVSATLEEHWRSLSIEHVPSAVLNTLDVVIHSILTTTPLGWSAHYAHFTYQQTEGLHRKE